MKQKMKTIFRILTLTLLISFTSCNEDENNQNPINTKQSNFNIRKLDKKEILQKTKVLENLNKIKVFKDKLSTSKIVYDPIYDFFINTDEALYIADGVSESYTFPIYRSSSSTVVENLVIYIKDNQSLVYLVDYGHSTDELQNMSQAQLEQNDVKHYLIDLNADAFITGKISAPHREHICVETYSWDASIPCNQGNNVGGSDLYCGGYVLTSSVCQWVTTGAGGGGSESSSGGDSTGPTGSGPTGGSTTTGSNTANSSGDPIINTTFYSPCTQCFEMTEEFSNFLNSLDANQLSYWNDLDNRTKISIVDYLNENNHSIESVEFVEELFDLANEQEIEFEINYQGDYTEFNNFNEVNDYFSFEEIDNSISNSVEFEQDKKISIRTIKLNLFVDLIIELVTTPNPTFSLDDENSTTDINTILPGNSWVQNSIIITNSNYGSNPDIAEISITGSIFTGIKVGDYTTGIKRRKQIIIRVNKNTGQIFYSEVKNIN